MCLKHEWLKVFLMTGHDELAVLWLKKYCSLYWHPWKYLALLVGLKAWQTVTESVFYNRRPRVFPNVYYCRLFSAANNAMHNCLTVFIFYIINPIVVVYTWNKIRKYLCKRVGFQKNNNTYMPHLSLWFKLKSHGHDCLTASFWLANKALLFMSMFKV